MLFMKKKPSLPEQFEQLQKLHSQFKYTAELIFFEMVAEQNKYPVEFIRNHNRTFDIGGDIGIHYKEIDHIYCELGEVHAMVLLGEEGNHDNDDHVHMRLDDKRWLDTWKKQLANDYEELVDACKEAA